jgi:hypothetical protein
MFALPFTGKLRKNSLSYQGIAVSVAWKTSIEQEPGVASANRWMPLPAGFRNAFVRPESLDAVRMGVDM